VGYGTIIHPIVDPMVFLGLKRKEPARRVETYHLTRAEGTFVPAAVIRSIRTSQRGMRFIVPAGSTSGRPPATIFPASYWKTFGSGWENPFGGKKGRRKPRGI
jgi:hypothetical protein